VQDAKPSSGKKVRCSSMRWVRQACLVSPRTLTERRCVRAEAVHPGLDWCGWAPAQACTEQPRRRPRLSARPRGAPGSIGTQTLDIIAEHGDRFELVALAAGGNVQLLAQQVRQFQPALVAIRDAGKLAELRELLRDAPRQPEILVGDEGAVEVARHADADAVVTGIVGAHI